MDVDVVVVRRQSRRRTTVTTAIAQTTRHLFRRRSLSMFHDFLCVESIGCSLPPKTKELIGNDKLLSTTVANRQGARDQHVKER